MLPNFLIVGAEKAGTTTVWATLDDHPDVYMCERKEPRFFTNQNWHRGLPWYESLFKEAEGHKAIGEASTVYTWAPESSDAPQRIRDSLGDIKYIYCVRNPIERMISHYRHALVYRWVPDETSFEDAIQMKPALEDCSRYYYQIEQYLPYTDPEQWHIVVLEELVAKPQEVMNGVFDFLGIDHMSLESLHAKNVTDTKVQPWISVDRLRPYVYFLPKPVRQWGKRMIESFGHKKIEKPSIDDATRAELVARLSPDIEALGRFCDKDFFALWQIEAPVPEAVENTTVQS